LIGIGFFTRPRAPGGSLAGNEKPDGANAPAPGSIHPGPLASCFTWLQAGRLKSTTDGAFGLSTVGVVIKESSGKANPSAHGIAWRGSLKANAL
jgi:hypothetical protein